MIDRRLDGRSDIYSLGVLLYESLAGRLPANDPLAAGKYLQNANPNVSRGLRDVLCKCLAVSPSARYRDASLLATDLRCHLASLPLRGVGNLSLIERWKKWRRRKPYAMPLAALTVAAIVVLGTIGTLFYRDRVHSAEALLLQSQHELASQQFGPAIDHGRAALDAVSLFPWQTDLKSRLKTQVATAKRDQARSALHSLVEELRFLDNQPLSKEKLATIAAGCAKVWNARRLLTPQSDGAAEATVPKLDESLRNDLLDFAILSSQIRGPTC